MIEVLQDMPDGVIGFEAVGEIHSADYETVLGPAIAAAEEHGEIRLVYVLGDRFEGYSTGAMWEDTKIGFGHMRHWKRTAIVSDHDWAAHLVKGLGWMMPGEVRHFPVAELDGAAVWAAADD